ncbi:hypothetical protein GCM10027514_22890 [Azotobacter armeniacus]
MFDERAAWVAMVGMFPDLRVRVARVPACRVPQTCFRRSAKRRARAAMVRVVFTEPTVGITAPPAMYRLA